MNSLFCWFVYFTLDNIYKVRFTFIVSQTGPQGSEHCFGQTSPFPTDQLSCFWQRNSQQPLLSLSLTRTFRDIYGSSTWNGNSSCHCHSKRQNSNFISTFPKKRSRLSQLFLYGIQPVFTPFACLPAYHSHVTCSKQVLFQQHSIKE